VAGFKPGLAASASDGAKHKANRVAFRADHGPRRTVAVGKRSIGRDAN